MCDCDLRWRKLRNVKRVLCYLKGIKVTISFKDSAVGATVPGRTNAGIISTTVHAYSSGWTGIRPALISVFTVPSSESRLALTDVGVHTILAPSTVLTRIRIRAVFYVGFTSVSSETGNARTVEPIDNIHTCAAILTGAVHWTVINVDFTSPSRESRWTKTREVSRSIYTRPLIDARIGAAFINVGSTALIS